MRAAFFFFGNQKVFFLLSLWKCRSVHRLHVDSTDSQPPTAGPQWAARPYRGFGATQCRISSGFLH